MKKDMEKVVLTVIGSALLSLCGWIMMAQADLSDLKAFKEEGERFTRQDAALNREYYKRELDLIHARQERMLNILEKIGDD